MKREAELKAKFTREFRKQAPQYVTLLQSTAGAPDRCITGDGVTSFWEFKHATPDFRSPGIQELMCMRLAEQGICWYVLWMEDRHGQDQHTLIVHPRHIHDKSLVRHVGVQGYDMEWLAIFVLSKHRR